MTKRTLSDRDITEEERREEEENDCRISAGDDFYGKTPTYTSSSPSAVAGNCQQQQQQALRCQVDNCDIDLTSAKRYHQRHKVCEKHAKAAAVVIGGAQQRYCQQCSRSCRERLAGHNERRRKVPPDQQMEDSGRVPAVLQVKDGTHGQVPAVKDSPWKQKGPSEVIKISLPRNPPVKHFQSK